MSKNTPLYIEGGMSLEIGSKNPISVLTEYSVKLNLNLRFENTTLKTGEFLFRVLKGQMQLGLGQDKKKQRAKSLAAESAINYLKSSSCPEDVEDQLSNELHKLKKTGNYKLVSAKVYLKPLLAKIVRKRHFLSFRSLKHLQVTHQSQIRLIKAVKSNESIL